MPQSTTPQYAITETQGSLNHTQWVDISAATLPDAKRAASRAQTFQGTTVAVASKRADGSYRIVAVKEDDPINMNLKGKWEDVRDTSWEDDIADTLDARAD